MFTIDDQGAVRRPRLGEKVTILFFCIHMMDKIDKIAVYDISTPYFEFKNQSQNLCQIKFRSQRWNSVSTFDDTEVF